MTLRATLHKRLLSLALAIVMVGHVALPPAQAMVTELVVGGTLLLQTLSVVAELLPQINALTKNLFDVFKTSRELADTVNEIFKPRGEGPPAPPGSSSPPGPIEVDVPTFTFRAARGDGAADPADDVPAKVPDDSRSGPSEEDERTDSRGAEVPPSMERQVALLIRTHHRRQELLESMTQGGADESVELEAIGSLHASLVEELATSLRAALEKGDREVLELFLTLAQARPLAERTAFVPSLKAFVEARRFQTLHGEVASPQELEDVALALEGLYRDLLRDDPGHDASSG